MPDREPAKPYSRGEFNRALLVNALLSPFNVLLLAAVLISGIVLGVLASTLPVAAFVYAIAVARTYFDEDVANKVLARERAERRTVAAPPLVDPATLSPGIARLVIEARERRDKVAAAIERADLPFAEVAGEVDAFVSAIEATAKRAQLLQDALAETPPAAIERRLAEVRGTGDETYRELESALETQLGYQKRMHNQLRRFHAEMERMLVELDTIRSQLVTVSASTEAGRQRELAGEVRALREQVGAVADGMAEAYDPAPPSS